MYGSESSPLSISFNFVPLWVVVEWAGNSKCEYIPNNSNNGLFTCLVSTLTTTFVSKKPFYGTVTNTSGTSYVKGKISDDRKTIYWYGIAHDWISLATVFNISGTKYIFSAYA